ncbi:ABC transporter ATP-binding protein [Ramlibacter tataouinensis]|uniref:Candidate ABC type multidrug transport system, ATP-binding and permease components n=1 Tax=Ramlibacter tataouinensis (strain ATCC BAA-407 / DSM 14655 / LMG 21543 / TTB310) TaxID=365046 RepID=F5Y3B2_RAMTT|nr:ABC transporter ATP-binding protein [Ramlibacter tataouinensis]AEG91199.1 candidate ABC type multidrug transport system, ATP-binding and permease components [Ramlibacter tataouinensis TTB310]
MPIATVRRALPWLHGFGRPIAAVLAVALLLAAATAAAPLAVMWLVDALGQVAAAQAAAPGAVAPAVLRTILLALALVAATELAQVVLSRLFEAHSWRVRLDIDFALRERITARLHQLPLSWHQRHTVGGTVSRVNTSINGFVAAVMELAFKALPAVCYLGLALVALLQLDWRLALAVCVFAPLPAVIGMRAAPEQTRRDRALLQHWTRIFGRWTEVLGGIRTVKGFAMEQAEERRFLKAVDRGNGLVALGAHRDAGTHARQALAAAAARLCVAGIGAWLVLRGHGTVGTLVAALQFVGGLFGPIQGLTNVYATVRRASVSMDAIAEMLDAPDPLADAPDARDLVVTRGAVAFDGVSFDYGDGRPVLRDVTLSIEPGQTVALVGPSGCGKTTLVSLLERLHAPTAGSIRVDGVDLRACTQRSLRSQVGTVMQDVHLFHDTILANITYGTPGATRAQAEVAARAANAHEFIERLPQGYDTVVGERGAGLSGGQKQRIAIARALLKDPPILVLDEATSALDNESEALVQAALKRLTQGRTTLVVAHRLSTVVDADRIVVLRGGQVDAVGTHAELLAQGGYYARLFAQHARGGLVEPLGTLAPAGRPADAGIGSRPSARPGMRRRALRR